MCSANGPIPWNQTLEMYYYNVDPKLVLYIPHLLEEYANQEYIQRIFKSLNIGKVEYVHFQNIGTVGNKTAIIYMKEWYCNTVVTNLQEKIKDKHQQARLVHDDPEYWVLLENKDTKEMISEQVAYSDVLNETMKQLVNKMENLSDKFIAFEKKYDKMNWTLKLHEANIKYLTTLNSKSDSTLVSRKRMYKDNSCCGAASDAWVPSYPLHSKL